MVRALRSAEVSDQVAAQVHQRVLEGMGLIVLHAAICSKVCRALLGTTGTHTWREAGEKERLRNVAPTHPIAQGVGASFELAQTEIYGEYLDIPTPDDLVFISWFASGEVLRSGCCWQRGYGRIFYFAPGHEPYLIHYDQNVRAVLWNAVQWAWPRVRSSLRSRRLPPCETSPMTTT